MKYPQLIDERAAPGRGTTAELRAPDQTTDQVIVFRALPPFAYGSAALFRRDPDVLERSRAALAEDRKRSSGDESYPYRTRTLHSTGLPAILTGAVPDGQAPDPRAGDEELHTLVLTWLLDDLRAQALTGFAPDEARARLRPADVVRFGLAERTWKGEQRPPTPSMHIRYQQMHGAMPVFGGSVVAHLAPGDRRAALTSSFFAVPSDTPTVPAVGEGQAIELAQRALAGYLEGWGTASFFWSILRPALEQTAARPWQMTHSHAIEMLAQAITERARQPADRLELALLADIASTAERAWGGLGEPQRAELEPLVGLAREVLAAIGTDAEAAKEGLQEALQWRGAIAAFAGSNLIVLPFAGHYYLAYQVEWCSAIGDQAWRVFVDASSGAMLGQPEYLGDGAQVQLASAGQSVALPGGELAALAADVDTFLRLEWHPSHGGGAINLASIDAAINPASPNEPVTIGFHANKIFEHFVEVGQADRAKLEAYAEAGAVFRPGLRAQIGQDGPTLTMEFVQAVTQHPKTITFQTAPANGLLGDGNLLITAPSLDPEVIYHELAHGLMWLLNRAPFDQQRDSVPFGRALVEGYATYFARSLASRTDAVAHELWARGAYGAGWSDRWALDRASQVPGADLLPAPNFYPDRQVTGLPVYDVGMVWARALWEIRGVLGPDLADRLALAAFQYPHGWVSSFEIAAEGLIDLARKDRNGFASKQERAAKIARIIDIFARRGILAERGIQALGALGQGQTLFAGSDAGVRRSDNGGANWGAPELANQGGVIALCSDDTSMYAATEGGIFQWNGSTANSAWAPIGAWPTAEAPLCGLVALSDRPLAERRLSIGTANGAWQTEDRLIWQPWGSAPGAALDAIARQIVEIPPGNTPESSARWRYAITIDGVMAREDDPQLGWENPGCPASGLISALASSGRAVYVGTIDQEIWRADVDALDWQKIVDPNMFGGVSAAVLCLAVDGNKLFVGTTSGLFEVDLNNPNVAQRVAGSPAASVMALLSRGGGNPLAVGTAADALWVRRAGAWNQIT